jgi:hypothetical protein
VSLLDAWCHIERYRLASNTVRRQEAYHLLTPAMYAFTFAAPQIFNVPFGEVVELLVLLLKDAPVTASFITCSDSGLTSLTFVYLSEALSFFHSAKLK